MVNWWLVAGARWMGERWLVEGAWWRVSVGAWLVSVGW
jgi:hypothetical protein